MNSEPFQVTCIWDFDHAMEYLGAANTLNIPYEVHVYRSHFDLKNGNDLKGGTMPVWEIKLYTEWEVDPSEMTLNSDESAAHEQFEETMLENLSEETLPKDGMEE